MLYGDLHVINTELKEYVCRLLQEQHVAVRQECELLLDSFVRTEEHVTAAELCRMATSLGGTLDEAAVGRALQIFSTIGLARELQLAGERQVRYEHFHPKTHHDHFICINCRKIMEFSDEQLEKVQASVMANRGFRPLFHRLEVYGICTGCQRSQTKTVSVAFIPEGTTVLVHGIVGGVGFRRKLMERGFVRGERITVIKNSNFGAVVLEVKGTRFALGRGEAEKIQVLSDAGRQKRT